MGWNQVGRKTGKHAPALLVQITNLLIYVSAAAGMAGKLFDIPMTGAIATSIPGISFGSTFAELAKRAHLVNVVRSFVTGDGNHDIKPVVGAATNRANLGSLYARVAGANRPRTARPTNFPPLPPACP